MLKSGKKKKKKKEADSIEDTVVKISPIGLEVGYTVESFSCSKCALQITPWCGMKEISLEQITFLEIHSTH